MNPQNAPAARGMYNQEYSRPMSESSYTSSGGSHSSHGSSSGGSHGEYRQHGAASGRSSSIDFTSIDQQDVRSSWWRFSDGFGRALTSPNTVGSTSPVNSHHVRRNTNRRINIQRGPAGDISGISRPQMQENSLLL